MNAPVAKLVEAAGKDTGNSVSQAGVSLTASVYLQLRADLLSGKFLPNTRLAIKMLQERYGTGSSPIREVLSRLTAEGFVVQIDQRGFRVPAFCADELEELTRGRCLLNEIIFREAIASANDADDEAIIVAHFRLTRTPHDLPGSPGTLNPESEEAHFRFHRALTAPCRLKTLLDFEEKLFERSTRYRVLAESQVRSTEAEHHAIMNAVLDRNTNLAIKLSNDHIMETASIAAAHLRSHT
ncbi:GntR family transcriptional regulator [Sphingomonas sp. HH69]|uniref:GntR family transcriptional regulator n=1 Tax=Sphingobium aromaticiconvertens TaxID=365341 RepID=UPI0009D72674